MMNNNSEDIKEVMNDSEERKNKKDLYTNDAQSSMNSEEDQLEKKEESTSINSENRGVYLKSIRQEKGISLETIHEATKIPLDALRAIEEGYTIRILTPFYLKGFIKIYASYLEVEIPEVSEHNPKEKLPKYIKSSYDEFNIQQWISSHLTRKRKQQIVIVCGFLILFFLLFKTFSFFANRPKKVKKVKVVAVGKNIEKKPSQRQTEQVVETQRTNTPPVQVISSGASQAKNVVLTVRAKQKSWLRVKADNAVVFQSTLREGAVETWKADTQIEIAGRNISELEFELNGKMIGALGRSNRKANRIVITKDGLSVLK